MGCAIKTSVAIIACVCVLKAGNCAPSDMEKSETLPLKAQYPENAVSEEPQRSSSAENGNSLGTPENDIKKLLRIKALPALNTALTKEDIRGTFWFSSNIKPQHKEVNAAAILNKTFCKFRPRDADTNFATINDDSNNGNFEVSRNGNNSETGAMFVLEELSINARLTNSATLRRTFISAKNAFPAAEKSQELRALKTKGSEIRFSNIGVASARRSSVLEFPGVPDGDVMKVPELKLKEEYFFFGVFSGLMGYLQPIPFPLGFVKDAVQTHASVHILVLKALKVEGPVLGWLFAWLLLALSLPCAVVARYCCTSKGMQRLRENSSDTTSSDLKWINTSLAAILHILLLLILGCILLILASNEEITRSTSMAPNAVEIILNDSEIFVQNTQTQISSVASASAQVAMDALHRDLEGAEELLGKPLQSALDAETGLETAMQALADIAEVTVGLSSRVSALLKDCDEARKVGEGLQGTLIELSRLLALARQECLPRDQALCDTLQTSGLNVSLQVDQLSSDKKLRQLQELSQNEKFNRTLEATRRMYRGLPRRVSLDTAVPRAEIRSALNRHRNQLYDAVQSLENMSRLLIQKLRSTRSNVHELIQNIVAMDLWRWLVILGLSLLIFFVWGLLMCGAPCGCEPTPKTIPFLLTGLGLACVLSPLLWAFGTAAFLLGGHCEALICLPLYDQPEYTVLGDLLNAGGILYHDEGLFKQFLGGNDSLRVESVLRNCENDEPAYTTFSLKGIFDLNLLLNYNEWQDFNMLIERFSVNLSSFEVLSPSLNQQLLQISMASEINLTEFRSEIAGSVTSRDLNSLAEQLESVAKQLSDLRSIDQMGQLALKMRNLASSDVQLLKERRDGILYKMAAVEILMLPLRKQVDQSLSHMKTIQYVINNQGSEIAQKVRFTYISRLENYLMEMYTYVNGKVAQDIGKCRPLWDVFHATRTIACRMFVDPVIGFYFACFFCILLFLGLAPVIFRTVAQYKEATEDSFSSMTHRRARNGLLIDDEGTWATPSPPSSSEEGQRQAAPSVDLPWTTPRQPSEPLIPSPPRPPEPMFLTTQPPPVRILDPARLIPASLRMAEPPRIIKSPIPRMLQPGTSTAARDRRETIKLIERIDRRTPRNWL